MVKAQHHIPVLQANGESSQHGIFRLFGTLLYNDSQKQSKRIFLLEILSPGKPGDHEKKVHMRQHFFRQFHKLKPLDGHWQSLLSKGDEDGKEMDGSDHGDGETPRKTTNSH